MMYLKWRHFPREIILMAVRWYVAYALSYRDSEELIFEGGVSVDHSTLNRWVIKYIPPLEAEFRKQYKRPVGNSWRMDETYVKSQGRWCYLYGVVDKEGNIVDIRLSKTRDAEASRLFFQKAIKDNGLPEKVTIDKSGGNYAGLEIINVQLAIISMMLLSLVLFEEALKLQINIRQIKYFNNVVEQDHRGIKKIIKPMMRFKAFYAAQATLTGIELHRMLRKGQHVYAGKKSIFEQFYGLAG